MIIRVPLELGLAANVDAQIAVGLLVSGAYDDREIGVAAFKLVGYFDYFGSKWVHSRADGECYERFVRVKTGVNTVKMLGLKLADRRERGFADHEDVIINSRKVLESVQEET